MQPVRIVPCPRCATKSAYAETNRWRPFCSERCRTIDLGGWADERYRVPESDGTPEPPAS